MIELIKALNVIKEECKKHGENNCRNCPMSDGLGHCYITRDIPESWAIKDLEVIRVFEK